MPEVSVIIPCKNEVNNLRKTVDSIRNSKNKLSYEIIIVNDGSLDGSCDFINTNIEVYKDIKLISTFNLEAAGSRNFGAKTALGKYLFFCDAHVCVPDYWIDTLTRTLEDNNAHIIAPVIVDMVKENCKGYGQTWNNNLEVMWLLDKTEDKALEIPIACGCAFGIKKEVFEAIGGFDKYFEVWGKEDEELCFKSWLFGYKIILDISVEVKHLFRDNHPYVVTHENVIYNFLTMACSHFGTEKLAKALNIAGNNDAFSSSAAKLMLNENLMKQREEYFRKRKYEEDYFFKKFNISF